MFFLFRRIPVEEERMLRTENEDLRNHISDLEDEKSSLMGHGNRRAKIKAHLKLKEQINDLQDTNSNLSKSRAKLKLRLKEMEGKYCKENEDPQTT